MPRSGPGPATARPSSSTRPALGRSRPATMRSSVDFPQPDGPRMVMKSFSATSSRAGSSARVGAPPRTPGKTRETPSTRSFGVIVRSPLPACGERSSPRSGPGERLCCWSSVLPWSVVADDGVEDGEEFSGCCDEGDHLGLSGGDEAVAEGLEGWVVTGGGHGSEEEDGAHGGAASADEAPAAPPPRLPGEGGKAGERRDLAPLEAAELGQLGQEGAVDDQPDGEHRDEEILFLAPQRRSAHLIADLARVLAPPRPLTRSASSSRPLPTGAPAGG